VEKTLAVIVRQNTCNKEKNVKSHVFLYFEEKNVKYEFSNTAHTYIHWVTVSEVGNSLSQLLRLRISTSDDSDTETNIRTLRLDHLTLRYDSCLK